MQIEGPRNLYCHHGRLCNRLATRLDLLLAFRFERPAGPWFQGYPIGIDEETKI